MILDNIRDDVYLPFPQSPSKFCSAVVNQHVALEDRFLTMGYCYSASNTQATKGHKIAHSERTELMNPVRKAFIIDFTCYSGFGLNCFVPAQRHTNSKDHRELRTLKTLKYQEYLNQERSRLLSGMLRQLSKSSKADFRTT